MERVFVVLSEDHGGDQRIYGVFASLRDGNEAKARLDAKNAVDQYGTKPIDSIIEVWEFEVGTLTNRYDLT